MMKKYNLVCAILCVYFLPQVQSYGDVICSVEEWGDLENIYFGYENKAILDTYIGDVQIAKTTNVTKIYFDDPKYINVKFENDLMTVFTTEAFKKYEETETNYIQQKINVECGNKSYDFRYTQRITYTNNYAPQFKLDKYEYIVYGPLKEDFILTNLLKINATELDINEYVRFSIKETEANDILEISRDDDDNKVYTAELQVIKLLPAPYDNTFTLIASDGEKSTEAVLHLELRELEDYEFKFKKDSYNAELVGTDIITDEFIQLEGGIDEEVIISLNEHDIGEFKASIDLVHNSISIKFNEKSRAEMVRTEPIKLTINAEWMGKKASTELIIDTEKTTCKIDNMNIYNNKFEHKYSIDDSHTGIVAVFNKTRNVKDMSCPDPKYFKCTFDAGVFTVFVTEEFGKYEENGESTETTFNVTVECNTENFEFLFKQKVIDINNHDPIFAKDIYEYNVYSGLKKGLVLTNLLAINATDMDMTLQQLYFSIEDNDDLKIDHVYSNDNKVFNSQLTTIRNIVPPYDKTYTITVKDSYYDEEFKSTTSKVKINLIAQDENIEFKKSEYLGTVIGNDIIISDDFLQLKDGVDERIQVDVTSDTYSGKIDANIDMVHKSINLKLRAKSRDEEEAKFIKLTVKASWNSKTATTEVLLNSENAQCQIGDLDWSYEYYQNPDSIDDNHSGTVKEFNKILNVEGATCSNSKYLDCSLNDGIFKVFVTDEYKNYEENESKTDISVDVLIKCKNEEKKFTFNQKINDLNTNDPIFEQNEYKYIFYTPIPNNLELTDVQKISATDKDFTDTNLDFSLEKNEYFRFTYSDKNGKINYPYLETKQEIRAPFNKSFDMAVMDRKRNTTTKIIIQVINEYQFNFEQEVYKGKVNQNGSIVISNGPIKIENGFDKFLNVNITEEYSEYFNVSKNQIKNRVQINPFQSLESLKKEGTIMVNIEAEWKGNVAKTVLHLNLINEVFIETEMIGFKNWLLISKTAQISLFVAIGLTFVFLIYKGHQLYFK